MDRVFILFSFINVEIKQNWYMSGRLVGFQVSIKIRYKNGSNLMGKVECFG